MRLRGSIAIQLRVACPRFILITFTVGLHEIKARSNRATMLAWFLLFTSCEAVAVSSGRFSTFATAVSSLQESMIAQAKAADPAAKWTVDSHARGKACIVEDGDVWEKGCISVTLIENGELSAVRAETISGRTGANIPAGAKYSACALSFVLHARSPLVPTLRGDARVFVVGEDEWYGGGLDLTPSAPDHRLAP